MVAHETDSQRLSSTGKTLCPDWDFINVPSEKKSDTESKMHKTESETTGKTSSSNNTVSSLDVQFSKLAEKNGVLDQTDSIYSSHIDTCRTDFNRPRNSPPPTPEDYQKYKRKIRNAAKERDIQWAVTTSMLREYDDEDYGQNIDQPFTMFPSNLGFNNGLPAARPGFIQGYLREAFEPYPIRDRLGDSAAPTLSKHPLALPHLVGVFKRCSGDVEYGRCQAAYNAACLVYVRNQASISMSKIDKKKTTSIGSFVSDGERL